MRKLSELLPIARKRLITADNPLPVHTAFAPKASSGFTCDAALYCKYRGEMTAEEYEALRHAILTEIRTQAQAAGVSATTRFSNVVLYLLLDEMGVYKYQREVRGSPHEDPAYFPHRDAWLDEFQAKLEGGTY